MYERNYVYTIIFIGTLPDSFTGLTTIIQFGVTLNPLLVGTLPDVWSQMTTFQILYLSNCTLTGK
jgi:hypothetical protein